MDDPCARAAARQAIVAASLMCIIGMIAVWVLVARSPGDHCLVDETAVVRNDCLERGQSLVIGRCNHFGVGCRVTTDGVGDGNMFDVNSVVCARGLRDMSGCCVGACKQSYFQK